MGSIWAISKRFKGGSGGKIGEDHCSRHGVVTLAEDVRGHREVAVLHGLRRVVAPSARTGCTLCTGILPNREWGSTLRAAGAGGTSVGRTWASVGWDQHSPAP